MPRRKKAPAGVPAGAALGKRRLQVDAVEHDPHGAVVREDIDAEVGVVPVSDAQGIPGAGLIHIPFLHGQVVHEILHLEILLRDAGAAERGVAPEGRGKACAAEDKLPLPGADNQAASAPGLAAPPVPVVAAPGKGAEPDEDPDPVKEEPLLGGELLFLDRLDIAGPPFSEDERPDRRQALEILLHGQRLGLQPAVRADDALRAEKLHAGQPVFGDGREEVQRGRDADAGLRDVEGVVRAEVAADMLMVVPAGLLVHIRADHIQMRGEGFPEKEVFGDGAAGRVAGAGDVHALLVQPDVGVGRDGVDLLAGGDLVDKTGHAVGLQRLVPVPAKQVKPAAGLLGAAFLPGEHRVLGGGGGFEPLHHLGGDGGLIQPLRLRAEIPDGPADDAQLILDLDRQHGLHFRVAAPDRLHQAAEGPLIRLESGAAERGEVADLVAVVGDDPPEAGRVLLDPLGDIFHVAVLPGAEPEEDQLEVPLPAGFDDLFDKEGVKEPLRRLEALPADGDGAGVDFHQLAGFPEVFEFLHRIARGVVGLRADGEKGLPAGGEYGFWQHGSSFFLL